MIRFVLVFFFITALRGFASDIAKIPPEHEKALADVSRFQEIHASSNLPPAVVALCADSNGRFAEPGQAWNPTDVIIDKSVPQRRLVWAATDGDYYVVHFERGGMGHSYRLLIVMMQPEAKKPTPVLRAGCLSPLKDYNTFLREIKAGSLYTRSESEW